MRLRDEPGRSVITITTTTTTAHDHTGIITITTTGTDPRPRRTATAHSRHLPPARISWRGLLALGVSGGLIPCPSALVVLLGSIALGRVGFGLALVVAFSLGLAATLTGLGILFLYAGRFFERRLRPAAACGRAARTPRRRLRRR